MEKYTYKDKQNTKRDFDGNSQKISIYQPTEEWKPLLLQIYNDYELGRNELTKGREELDGKSIEIAFRDYYKAFIGSTRTHASSDPESDWQTYAHKPLIQNKSQIFIAHAVADMMYPAYVAQDSASIPDKQKSQVLQILGDRVFNDKEFQDKIIRAVTTITYSPYALIEKGFSDGLHWIRLVDVSSFMFSNYYESDIQKQRFIIKREYIDYFDAQDLYSSHENWKYITPSQNCYYDFSTGFYRFNEVGLDRQHLVERIIYMNKARDVEITLINGIPVCKVNQKIKRLGKKKKRPYPYAILRFENLGRETIVGRPLAQKLWSDEKLASFLQSIAYDMARQAVSPSIVAYGDQNITARIMAPGTVTNAGGDKNFEIKRAIEDFNISPAITILDMITRNADEASNSDALRGGITGSGSSAREVIIANNNAKVVQQGTFIKNMEKFIREIGYLVLDDVFQYEFVKNIEKSTNNIKYVSAFVSKTDDALSIVRLNDEKVKNPFEKQLKLLDEIEKNQYKTLYEINPDDYRDIEFITEVSVQQSQVKNKDLQKALAIEFHQVMANNPYYDLLEGTKKLVEQYYPEETETLVKEPQPQQGQQQTQDTPGQSQGDAILAQQQTQKRMPTTNQLLNNTIDTMSM